MNKVYLYLLFALSAGTNAETNCDRVSLNYLVENKTTSSHCSTEFLNLKLSKNDLNLALYEVQSTDLYATPKYRGYSLRSDTFSQYPFTSKARTEHWDLSALASDKIKRIAEQESLSSSNLIPMPPSLNRSGGVWDKLNHYEIEKATQIGQISVVAGYFQNAHLSYYFKVYINAVNQNYIAFLINEKSESPILADHITSMECIEAYADTGIFNQENKLIRNLYNSSAFSIDIWTPGGTAPTRCPVSSVL